jgi:hypothetical protein
MDRRTSLTGSMKFIGKSPASEELDRACAQKGQA